MRRFLLLLIAAPLFAKDFGRAAEEFPIQEENMETHIQRTVAPVDTEILRSLIEAYATHPPPLTHLTPTQTTRKTLVDFSYTPTEDILAGDVILAQAGEVINPLVTEGLDQPLLFFDATDPAQLAWARAQPTDSVWILTNGSPIQLEEQEQREVFFDQYSLMTGRLALKHVPARATQQGGHMLVEELALTADGQELP